MSNMLILDRSATEIAQVEIKTTDAGRFTGTIVWHKFPPGLADALSEYAYLVENQIFSSVDQVRETILAFELQARETIDGKARKITELQMYSNGTVTIELSEVP